MARAQATIRLFGGWGVQPEDAHARNFSRSHVFHHQNPLRTAPMTRRLTLTLLAALPALLAPTGAQAAKPVGPKLTITERLCNRGADPSERSIVLTVNAALPTASTAVQLRFTVQRRATKKGRWSTVPATPDSGWASGRPARPAPRCSAGRRPSTALTRASSTAPASTPAALTMPAPPPPECAGPTSRASSRRSAPRSP